MVIEEFTDWQVREARVLLNRWLIDHFLKLLPDFLDSIFLLGKESEDRLSAIVDCLRRGELETKQVFGNVFVSKDVLILQED